MRTILALATVSLAVLLSTASLQAHHSFSATYDGNKPITLRGTIVKMGWQNPHAHLYVDVKNADGKVVTWEVESAGPTALMKQGLRKEDFVGAEVIIKGFLAKDGTPTLNASSFTLVDAKKEFVSDEKTP
ncbi:MAG TPA: DUF6152 family protein [Vicinamibacterales bacterium]|jgi:hypothetical protein|nr:DUF6152 family protein [Vicinamibacterales bacterium]